MSHEADFTRQLIKGKIVETLFEMMMREMDRVTVLQVGYEHTYPELRLSISSCFRATKKHLLS